MGLEEKVTFEVPTEFFEFLSGVDLEVKRLCVEAETRPDEAARELEQLAARTRGLAMLALSGPEGSSPNA